MKKKTIIILIASLAVSLLGNIFFLTQDFFNGTYIGRRDADEGNFIFTVDHQIVKCKLYEKSGEIRREWTCYIDSATDEDIFITTMKGDVEILRIHKNSIFSMHCFDETSWFVCPAAIIIQVLWIAADSVLVVLLLKKLGLPRFRLQIVKKEPN